MQFEAKLTLDGLMTLIAGVIAFSAVIIQIRSSSKSVTTQIETERHVRLEEDRRGKQAVARALLFETLNFYRTYKEEVKKPLDTTGSHAVQFPTLGSPGPGAFAVYRANAGKLGHFDDEVVQSVVTFYVEAEWFVSTLQSFNWSVYRELELYKTITMGSTPVIHLSRLRKRMPSLDQAALAACRNLCAVAGVSYDSLQLEN
jgi:hypothetical protein